jgi:hypothetical protein
VLAPPHDSESHLAVRRFSSLFLISWGIRILVIFVVLWILMATGVL